MTTPEIKSTSVICEDGLKQNHGMLTFVNEKVPDLLDFKGILEYPSIRVFWDDAFAFAKIINVASEREVIAHSFTKSFWPVQARDLIVSFRFEPKNLESIVSSQSLRQIIDAIEQGGYSIVTKSTEADYQPETGYTRAHLHFATFQLAASTITAGSDASEQTQLQIDYNVKSDPRGMIPKRLLGMLSDMVPKNLQRIFEYLELKGPPPAIIHSHFGSSSRMSNVEYIDGDSSSTLHLSFERQQLQNQFSLNDKTISIVSVSKRWLEIRGCTSANVELSDMNNESKTEVRWIENRDKYYVMLEIQGTVSIKIMPNAGSDHAGICKNGHAIAASDSDAFDERIQQASQQITADLKLGRQSAPDGSEDSKKSALLGKYVLKALQVAEHTFAHLKTSGDGGVSLVDGLLNSTEFVTVGIPDPPHPIGIVYTRKSFPIPSEYSGQDFIDCTNSVLSNPCSRKIWDPLFESGELVACYDLPANLLSATTLAGEKILRFDQIRIGKSRTKSIWPVASRALSVFLIKLVTERRTVMLAASVPPDLFNIQVAPGAVVADLDISFWSFEVKPVAKLMQIEYIMKTKPNGDIPNFILDRMSSTFPQHVVAIMRHLDQYGAMPFLSCPYNTRPLATGSSKYGYVYTLMRNESDSPVNCLIDLKWLTASGGQSSLMISFPSAEFELAEGSETHLQVLNLNIMFQYAETTEVTFELLADGENSVYVNGDIIWKHGRSVKSTALADADDSANEIACAHVNHLQHCLHFFHQIISNDSSLSPLKLSRKSVDVDVDGNFIESFLLGRDILRQFLKRNGDGALVERSSIPHLYLLKPATADAEKEFVVVLRKKVKEHRDQLKTFILALRVVSVTANSKTEYQPIIAAIIRHKNTLLTRKSCVDLLFDGHHVNAVTLLAELKRLTVSVCFESPVSSAHRQFDNVGDDGMSSGEVVSRSVPADDFLISYSEAPNRYEISVVSHCGKDGGKSSVIIPFKKSCEVIIDSDSEKVLLMNAKVREDHWMVGKKLYKFWVVELEGLAKGVEYIVYVRYKKTGRGIYINGICNNSSFNVQKNLAIYNTAFLFLVMILAILIRLVYNR